MDHFVLRPDTDDVNSFSNGDSYEQIPSNEPFCCFRQTELNRSRTDITNRKLALRTNH